MNRFIRAVLLVLSLLALFVIMHDYEFGHMGEDLLHPEWCPLCYSFQSAELGHLLVVFLLFVGILSLAGFLSIDNSTVISSFHLSLSSPRAPPVF